MPMTRKSKTNNKYFNDIPIFQDVDEKELNNMLSVIDQMHAAEKRREEETAVFNDLLKQKKKKIQGLNDRIKNKKSWLYKFKESKKR